MEEVNRLFSLDALVFIPIIVLIFHIILIKNKEWKTIAVFNIAGILNFLLEIFLINGGTRIVEASDIFMVFLVLFTLSWIDIGLFCALNYININRMYRNSDISTVSLLILNLIFFVGMPLASINWGIFDSTILTRRIVLDSLGQQILQLSCIILFSVILFLTGYRKLTSLIVLQGIILGFSFQSRLYLAGIRQASTATITTMIIDTLTLATIPIIVGAFLFIILRRVHFLTFGDKPPLPTRVMNLRITLAAAKVLINHLGLKVTFALVKELANQRKEGEPWKNLPKSNDKKDIDSRALIGDAILIYRSLLKRIDKEKAIKLIKELVIEAAMMQLYSLVPKIKAKDALNKSQEEIKNLLTEIVEKFPNTDWEMIESTKKSFAYRITRCRLVELINDLGLPELKDAFCPGDELYFERFQPDIKFSRPKNIGMQGDKCCEFIFAIKEK